MATENILMPTQGRSVRSLQTFLRVISNYYKNAPIVIPDGNFGQQTEFAVLAFQKTFGLPESGEVDYTCWIKILEVYDNVIVNTKEPDAVKLIPKEKFNVNPNDKGAHIIAVKGILSAISYNFQNFHVIHPSDVHDSTSFAMVKDLQKLFALGETGIIDRITWDNIAALYEAL